MEADEPRTEELLQKGVAVSFVADGRAVAVAGMDDCGVGKLQDFAFERGKNLVQRTSPKIGSANAPCKKRIPGEELRLAQTGISPIGWQIKRNAARRVPRGVHHICTEFAPFESISVFQQLVNFDQFRGRHPEERRLDLHATVEGQVVTVHHHGRPRVLVKLREAADMVDVRMRADYGFHLEFVAPEKAENAFDFISGIDDDALQSVRIANDGAVALQEAYRDLEVDHLWVGRIRQSMGRVHFIHKGEYIIGVVTHQFRRCHDWFW